MALDQSALLELLDVMRSADGGELMRRLLATIVQLLVDAEATAFVGAERHERSQARTNRRNGTRDKLVATATGDIAVKILHGTDLFPPGRADPSDNFGAVSATSGREISSAGLLADGEVSSDHAIRDLDQGVEFRLSPQSGAAIDGQGAVCAV